MCVKAKDDKRLGVDSDLVRTPSYMTMLNRRLQVAERILFLTVLPMAMFEEPRHYLRRVSNYVMIGMLFIMIVARTCCFAGLKGLRESFLAYQVWCHHSKYSDDSLSGPGGQLENDVKRVHTGKHGNFENTVYQPEHVEAHFTLKYSMSLQYDSAK